MMLLIPGAWACDEMGALLAGVFCGVLVSMVSVYEDGCDMPSEWWWRGREATGRVGEVFVKRGGID